MFKVRTSMDVYDVVTVWLEFDDGTVVYLDTDVLYSFASINYAYQILKGMPDAN